MRRRGTPRLRQRPKRQTNPQRNGHFRCAKSQPQIPDRCGVAPESRLGVRLHLARLHHSSRPGYCQSYHPVAAAAPRCPALSFLTFVEKQNSDNRMTLKLVEYLYFSALECGFA
jgi:hypothetical protein